MRKLILIHTLSVFFFTGSTLAKTTSYADIYGQRMALKQQIATLNAKCQRLTNPVQKRNCELNLRIFYNQEAKRLQRLAGSKITKDFEKTQ